MKLAGHANWPMRLTVTGDDLCLHGVQQLKQVEAIAGWREGGWFVHCSSETSWGAQLLIPKSSYLHIDQGKDNW